MVCHGEELSAVLRQKLKAYEEFQSVTGLLQTALESDEMNEVLRCIKRREELMRDIEGLDLCIARHGRLAPPDQRQAINRLLADSSGKLGEKLERIFMADRDCTAIAARKHEEMRRELAVIRHQREGVHGYALKSDRAPRFLNVRT
jgi:hypothetical protein